MRLLGLSPALAIALLAAVAVVIVALYLLKPPPRRVTVASNLIWARVLGRKRRDSERWRWWLALALSLAIGLGLAAAIARPEADQAGGSARQWVIVVDNSPTMAALRSDARTRLDHARERARAIIEGGGASGRYLVADTMGTIAAPAFQDRARALDVLSSLAVSADGTPRLPRLAEASGTDADARVVLVTDGVARLEPSANVRTVSVFEPVANAGITAFDVRAWPGDARRFEAFVTVANAGDRPVQAVVTLAGAGHEPIEQTLSVAARDVATASVPVAGFSGGPLRASVHTDDDGFDADDVAWAFLPLTKVARVALVTTGNAALEQALRLDGRIALTVLAPKQFAARAGFDAYVFDRYAPPVPPAAPALLFRPPAVPWLPAVRAVREAPSVDAWLADHPVLDNVSLRDADIRRSATFAADAPGTLVLARDAGGAALVVAATTMPRWIATGFALEDTNFAAQASFPMFVANASAWLLDEPPALARAPGTVSVPLDRARILTPEGTPTDTRFVPGATLFRADTPGVYAAEGAGGRLRVLVNRLDPAVTDINATRLAAPPPETADAPAFLARREPWMVLLLVAIALMLAEWWTYHRRITV